MPKRKAQTAVPAVPKASLGTRIKKDIIKNYQLYLLMIPGFLLLILFKIGPVGAMVIAFEDFSAAKGVFGSTWVGLENFKRILQDPYIWKITKNTIVLAFLSVVVVFPIPIIFSLFLNEVRTKWVRNTVQSLSFLPYFISAAVMVSIMYTLLSPTSGLINILITKLGGTSTNFMAKPEWFRPLYVILEIWQTFGYSAIIYIAAMMNIDPTLYEAAEIDGASRWTKMWRITLPCISTSVITMLIISVGNIFSVNLDRILLLVAVCCVYPFLYVFFVATTDGTYLARGEMTFLPMGFNLKAFGYILTNPRFNVFAGMRNSFLYTALGTLLAVACTYVTAYVLSRPRFKHRYWLMSLFIITWVFDAGIIPQYIIYNQFGFVNSPWVMIVPGAISTQFLIITKTFLEGIPNELEEAAVVDGASDIKILTRVFLPLSPTVLATTGLFYAVSIWNQYLIPQIYLKDDAIKTIQQVLKNVVITDGGSGTTFKNVVLDGVTLNQQNLKAAAIFIAMLPIICVYPFVQKYFKKGILIGSVKG